MSVNLVANPSFENLTTGWADDWTRGDETVFTIDTNAKGQSPYATNSLKVTLDEDVQANCLSDKFLVDHLKSYYFSFTLHVHSYSAGSVDWKFEEYNVGDEWVSWQYKAAKSEDGCWRITGTYTPTDSDVAKAEIGFYYSDGNAIMDAYIDQVEVFEINSDANGAKVTICFDDGFSSVYDNRFAFSTRSIPITWFIVSDWVGTAEKASWAQIKNVYDNLEWEIGNHSKTHADLAAANEATIVTEITTCNTAINTNVGATSTNIAWPGGSFDDLSKEVAARYLRGMRTHTAYGDGGDQSAPYEDTWLLGTSVKNTDSVADVKGWIDTAVNDGDWLILIFHELVAAGPGEFQWTVSDMVDVLKYIQTKVRADDIQAVTMEQGRNLYEEATPPVADTGNMLMMF